MDNASIRMFLATALVAVVVGQYSVKIRLSANKVKMGDEVTVTCDVTNHLNTTVQMSWIRKIGQVETAIAPNQNLKEEYQKTGRYSLSSDVIARSHQYSFKLKIKDLKASDSGDIGCLLPDNHIEIFKTLSVQSPVQTVRLNSTNLDNTHAIAYQNDQTVYFKEGDIQRFACVASGSYPEPRVRVFVGQKDITDTFSVVSRLVEGGIKAIDGKIQFINSLHYEVKRTNDHLNISHDFNKKVISCVADLPGSDFPTTNTSIEVRLSDFCPKFECGHEISARLHQRNVELRCRVIGEPEVTNGSFHWKRATRGNLSIEVGESDGTFTGYLKSKSGDGIAKEMVLRIGHMYPQHFRSYIFEARNTKCSSLKEMVVRRDVSMDSLIGAASSSAMTTTTRIVIAAIIIITVVVATDRGSLT